MCDCYAGPKAVYSYAELAALSGLSRHQVRHLVKRNAVSLIRSGKKAFVPLAALRAALPWLVDSFREADGLRATG